MFIIVFEMKIPCFVLSRFAIYVRWWIIPIFFVRDVTHLKNFELQISMFDSIIIVGVYQNFNLILSLLILIKMKLKLCRAVVLFFWAIMCAVKLCD